MRRVRKVKEMRFLALVVRLTAAFWATLLILDPALLVSGGARAASLNLVASILPVSRSVQIPGPPPTTFAVILNAGSFTATNVRITLVNTGLPFTFTYQETDPITNLPFGPLNPGVDIPPHSVKTFLMVMMATGEIPPTNLRFNFQGDNTSPAPLFPGVNTFLFSSSLTPVPDPVALSATCKSDDNISQTVNIPGSVGIGVFAAATVNLGTGTTMTVFPSSFVPSIGAGTKFLPVLLSICQTDPGTGACLAPPTPSVTLFIGAGATPTFAVFVHQVGPTEIEFRPELNRIFVQFVENTTGLLRGLTSVAVRNHDPICAP